mmetsp:Transcript_67479/g.109431  ORF Transcript_67479/g.109431 Transcript_67479/m.109431 type:complete len:121 (+) Transcript_67479:4-366(+)
MCVCVRVCTCVFMSACVRVRVCTCARVSCEAAGASRLLCCKACARSKCRNGNGAESSLHFCILDPRAQPPRPYPLPPEIQQILAISNANHGSNAQNCCDLRSASRGAIWRVSKMEDDRAG